MAECGKIQHYVPRLILKSFASPDDESLWAFDKHTENVFNPNINRIAAEKYFYNFTDNDKEYTLEPSLANIENQVAIVIRKILEKEALSEISNNERLLLSRFISIQFLRTPRHRNMPNHIDTIFRKKMNDLGHNIENIKNYHTLDNSEIRQYHAKSIVECDRFTPYFFDKLWMLFKSPKEEDFWISDNPIILHNEIDYGPYGNIGIGVKGIEIYMPISPTFILGMLCPTLRSNLTGDMTKHFLKGTPIQSNEQNVLFYNSGQVIFSERFIFSRNNDFSLVTKMLKRNPNLKKGFKPEIA